MGLLQIKFNQVINFDDFLKQVPENRKLQQKDDIISVSIKTGY